MIHFYSDYCHRKLWICISFGTIFIACCILIILFIYHYQRRYRSKRISHFKIKPSAQNFNENMLENSKRNRNKNKNLDQQVEELIRLTPIIPFEKIKLNEFNQIIIITKYKNLTYIQLKLVLMLNQMISMVDKIHVFLTYSVV